MFSKLDNPEISRCIFHPRKENITPLPPSSIDIEIAVSGKANLLGCRLHWCDKTAPLILYFHGNGETVSDYDTIAKSYTDVGLNIFIATYRGYGWSTGEPLVSNIYQDASIIVNFMLDYLVQNNFDGPLFLMGRSLGSAIAIETVIRFPDIFKGLLLDSAFAMTLPLLEKLGCVIDQTGLREDEGFNNLDKIKKITIPTMILHGARDQLISVSEAEKLQSESGARTKQFHVIPGADHNTLISNGGKLYFETIKKFTDTVTGRNTWRKRRKKYRKTNS